jgi:hypothetical protein
LQQSKEAPDLADKVEEGKLKLEEGAGARRSVGVVVLKRRVQFLDIAIRREKSRPAP